MAEIILGCGQVMMQKLYKTKQSSGHSLIELIICCVLVLAVMLAIGAGMVYVSMQDSAYKDRAEMMEDMTFALGIIAGRFALATNIVVTTDGDANAANSMSLFPAGGVALDTNLNINVRRYDVLWTINDMRQVVFTNCDYSMGSVTNMLINAQSGRSITSFTCQTNISRSVQLSMSMQKVRTKGGRRETNSAALSNIWVKLLGAP